MSECPTDGQGSVYWWRWCWSDMAWAKLIIVIIQSVTSSGSLSHGLHDLTPAPYLHPKHQTPNPKYNPKWYHHEKQEGMQAYQNMRHSRPLVSEYTVYRNPYDVTGPRELDDAVRTQDEDVIVSGSFESFLFIVKH